MEIKEIKEAIMFLENTMYMGIRGKDEVPGYEIKYNHWIKKIIDLLKRGKKFEAIVTELEEINNNGMWICTKLDDIKQKYFSKE